MPLMICTDCGKEISDRAQICIGCGAPVNQVEIIETILNNKFQIKYEAEKKSPGLAVILGFCFGPFGTFYVNTLAGFTMLGLYLASLIFAVFGIFVVSMLNLFVCYFYCLEFNEKLKLNLLAEQGKDINNSSKLKVEEYDISSGW